MQRMKGQANQVPHVQKDPASRVPLQQNFASFPSYSSPLTSVPAPTDPYISNFFMTSYQAQSYGVGSENTWSNGSDHLQATFLNTYAGHSMPGYDLHNHNQGMPEAAAAQTNLSGNTCGPGAPASVLQSGYNPDYHHTGNNANSWAAESLQQKSSKPGDHNYDVNRGSSLNCDSENNLSKREASLEQSVRALSLGDKSTAESSGPEAGQQPASHDAASEGLTLVSQPKKSMSWANIASQPAKQPPARRKEKTVLNHPRHMDIGTWDNKNGSGAKPSAPIPAPRPAWEPPRTSARTTTTYTSPAPQPSQPPVVPQQDVSPPPFLQQIQQQQQQQQQQQHQQQPPPQHQPQHHQQQLQQHHQHQPQQHHQQPPQQHHQQAQQQHPQQQQQQQHQQPQQHHQHQQQQQQQQQQHPEPQQQYHHQQQQQQQLPPPHQHHQPHQQQHHQQHHQQPYNMQQQYPMMPHHMPPHGNMQAPPKQQQQQPPPQMQHHNHGPAHGSHHQQMQAPQHAQVPSQDDAQHYPQPEGYDNLSGSSDKSVMKPPVQGAAREAPPLSDSPRLEESTSPVLEDLQQRNKYNPPDLDLDMNNARFFVIKSYSEDDVHRSIKYEIWCSTEHGNMRLDKAFKEQAEIKAPIYLLFSVNGTGHFCGVAEMLTCLDYSSSASVWAQDKWKGQFKVKWIYVKDVPNPQLRHIKLENNENKPVTKSRDTQEVPHEKGKQVLQIFHSYRHTSSIFDDFTHYERRQEEIRTKRSYMDGCSEDGRPSEYRDYRNSDQSYYGGHHYGGRGGRGRGYHYNNYHHPQQYANYHSGGGGGRGYGRGHYGHHGGYGRGHHGYGGGYDGGHHNDRYPSPHYRGGHHYGGPRGEGLRN